MEKGVNPVERFPLEGQDFPFAVHDQAQGDALYASGRKFRLDFAPEHGGEFEADQAVEDAAGLLGVHQVHIDVPGIVDGLEDGCLGDFVEGDAPGVFLPEPEGLEQVPGDGLSFAVLIGCEPDGFGLGGHFF